ncbi:hypothetical protein BH10ACT1_BH10ACT1_36180 [soil metagenome]
MNIRNRSVRAAGALAVSISVLLVTAACEPVDPGTTTTTTTSTTTTAPTTTTSAPTTTTTTPTSAGDLGWEGPSFDGASGSPSGSKPESKLWFNDGTWWADLWDTASGDFYIHRLDLVTHQWVRTSARLDDRPSSRSDTLWDGTHLFVASHAFAEGSSNTATGYPAELRRFSYDASTDTYALDSGFPVVINDARSESLVIEEDSLGRIWATWMQNAQIMTTVSSVGGTSFAAPSALPVSGTKTSSDDLSSVLAFGGDKIGILWSNEDDEKMYFTSRSDSSPLGTWSATEVAYQGTKAADDHINLKNVADQNGRILAAVKTSGSGSDPLVHLLDRNPTTGVWTSHVFGLASNNHTRPIVLVDRTHQVVHMFATANQSGGSIYEKTAPLSNIDFAPGKGTPVLTDASDPDINNATSTKQALDSTTGLVVLATNDSTRRYWTYYDPLGGSTPTPTAPVASFTAAPPSGPAPLDVAFTDTSSGAPTSWSWNFGDGTTSTAQSPVHRYTAAGSYTVSLTATNATSSSTSTRNGLVNVGPASTTRTFVATADAPVKSSSPTKNYGSDPDLRTRAGDPAYSSYLRFDLSGLASAPKSAKLRLYVTDASKVPGSVRATSTSWTESTITWNNAPAGTGAVLANAPASTLGTWIELDVTAAVTGNGPVSFVISTTSTDSGISSSRETANPPQLVVVP